MGQYFIPRSRKRLWKWIPRSKSGASKSRPRWAALTRIGNVWEYWSKFLYNFTSTARACIETTGFNNPGFNDRFVYLWYVFCVRFLLEEIFDPRLVAGIVTTVFRTTKIDERVNNRRAGRRVTIFDHLSLSNLCFGQSHQPRLYGESPNFKFFSRQIKIEERK